MTIMFEVLVMATTLATSTNVNDNDYFGLVLTDP